MNQAVLPVEGPSRPPRGGGRTIGILAAVALAALAGAGYVYFFIHLPARSREAVPPPEAVSSGAERLADPKLEGIRSLFKTIPSDYREARDLAKLTADVRACRDRCEAYLAEFPRSKGAAEARFMMARCALSLNKVEWVRWVEEEQKRGRPDRELGAERKQWAEQYFALVIQLARTALEEFPRDHELRAACLDVLADALLQAGKPAEALERYRQLIAEYPSYKELANTYMAMAGAYQELERAPEGIELMRKALGELSSSPSYPYFYDWLWKLHTAAGDLPGLLALAEEMQTAFPRRAKREGIGKIEKETCDRLLGYNGFRLGYSRFALGDFTGAAEAFQGCIDFLNAWEKERPPLPQDLQVYRDIRCRDNLEALETRIGKPPGADLTSVLWAGDRKLELDGRPVAIYFRNPGDERSAPLLSALDRHARERGGAYELAAVTYPKGGQPGDEALQVIEDARKLGLQCAVGIDPEARVANRGLFHAFKAAVGSNTLVVLDRAGRYVWFQQDAKESDRGFSLAIIERILKD